MSDNYNWLSKAAEAEALLDNLRIQYEQMKVDYERRILDLEARLLEANCMAQTTGVTNESIQ
jgi:hypothetical protein